MTLNLCPLQSNAHPCSERDGQITQYGGETLIIHHQDCHRGLVVAGRRGHLPQKRECFTVPQNQVI